MGLTQQLLLTCALFAATAAASSAYPSFAEFMAKHGRTFAPGTQEYEMRSAIYAQKLQQVQLHNSKAQRRWNAAVNHLSDRTEAEFAQLRGLRATKSARMPGMVSSHSSGGQFLGQVRNIVLPDEKDWTSLQAVQASTDQISCGSCWAVATSTVLTANAEINGHNRTFSAQELVSCAPNPHKCGGNGGCSGSTVELAMNWVMERGLATLQETPYLGSDSQCKKTVLLQGVGDDGGSDHSLKEMTAVGIHMPKSQSSPAHLLAIQSWERLPENEYQPLMRAAAAGPVAVSVAADAWSLYDKGILDSCQKDAVIDHAVALVGYGIDRSTKDKYWIIKNSWGNGWGENGNIRLLREEGNVHCGTDKQPLVGTGCTGGPSTVPVCGMCGILYDAVAVKFKPNL